MLRLSRAGEEGNRMPLLKVYNREIVDARTYPSALARGVHFAVSICGGGCEPLNYNYGILYPKARKIRSWSGGQKIPAL